MEWASKGVVAQLREAYLAIDMPGMVELIDYLVEMDRVGTPRTTIGSSTINLHNVLNDILVNEQAIFEAIWFRTFKFHFGKKGVPPLIDIAEMGLLLEQAPPAARKKIDEVCRMFAQIPKMEAAADVEVSDKDGLWRIPKDEWNAWKKDPSKPKPRGVRIEHLFVDRQETVDVEEFVKKLN